MAPIAAEDDRQCLSNREGGESLRLQTRISGHLTANRAFMLSPSNQLWRLPNENPFRVVHMTTGFFDNSIPRKQHGCNIGGTISFGIAISASALQARFNIGRGALPNLNSARGALAFYLLVAGWRIQSVKIALFQCSELTCPFPRETRRAVSSRPIYFQGDCFCANCLMAGAQDNGLFGFNGESSSALRETFFGCSSVFCHCFDHRRCCPPKSRVSVRQPFKVHSTLISTMDLATAVAPTVRVV